MCFMALNKEVQTQNSCVDDFLYDELSLSFDELLANLEKLATKVTFFKKKNASHFIEFEKISTIENEKEALVKENILLKEKLEDLTKIVYKFTLGKKNFDMLICEQ